MMDWRWPEVDALESQGKWNEAKSLLLENWKEKPDDLKTSIRLGFHCWYFLAEDAYQHFENVDLDEMVQLLNQVKDYGLLHFMEDGEFLWCFGYMVYMYPFYFGEYNYWEAKSLMMLKRATERFPEKIVYRYTYLSCFSDAAKEQKAVYYQLQTVLKEKFKGDGLLSDYFISTWNQWHGA